jgi:hypothetical protein
MQEVNGSRPLSSNPKPFIPQAIAGFFVLGLDAIVIRPYTHRPHPRNQDHQILMEMYSTAAKQQQYAGVRYSLEDLRKLLGEAKVRIKFTMADTLLSRVEDLNRIYDLVGIPATDRVEFATSNCAGQ